MRTGGRQCRDDAPEGLGARELAKATGTAVKLACASTSSARTPPKDHVALTSQFRSGHTCVHAVVSSKALARLTQGGLRGMLGYLSRYTSKRPPLHRDDLGATKAAIGRALEHRTREGGAESKLFCWHAHPHRGSSMADCEANPAPGCNQAPCDTCGWWAETCDFGNGVGCNGFLFAWCRAPCQRCVGDPFCGRCVPPATHGYTRSRPAGLACITQEDSGVLAAARRVLASEAAIRKKAASRHVLGSTLATRSAAILSDLSAPKRGGLAAPATFLSFGTKKLAAEIGDSTREYPTTKKSCGRGKFLRGPHDSFEKEETPKEAAAPAVASLLACGLLCADAFAERKL